MEESPGGSREAYIPEIPNRHSDVELSEVVDWVSVDCVDVTLEIYD